MFDIGWSELLLIAVIAIVVVGPKELPALMRTVGRYATKMRRMVREAQGQFEEALREAELDEVRKEMRDIGRLDPLREVREGLAKPLKSVRDDIEKAGQDIAAAGAPEATSPPAAEPATGEGAAPPDGAVEPKRVAGGP